MFFLLCFSRRFLVDFRVIMLQFNDMLLVCVALPLLPGVKQQYKVKAKLDISGMRVCVHSILFSVHVYKEKKILHRREVHHIPFVDLSAGKCSPQSALTVEPQTWGTVHASSGTCRRLWAF